MVDKKEKVESRFQLGEIPTEMGIVCRDNETETNLSQFELMVQIANSVSKIEKTIVGGK